MKPLHLVLGLSLLAVLAGAALWLSGPDDGGTVVGVSAPVVVDALPESRTTGTLAPVESTRETLAAPVAALGAAESVVERAMPESYRRALGAVVGRLVEESGEPVPGLPVELLGGGTWDLFKPLDILDRGGSLEIDPRLGETVSDASGRFRFEGLETRVLGALLVDGGGTRGLLHPLEQTPVSGQERDLGDIVLPAGATLVGRVVNGRGQPMPGARVRATDLPTLALASGIADWRPGGALLVTESRGLSETPMVIDLPDSLERLERLLPVPSTFTDGEGRFRLSHVRPGLVTVVADDGRHLTALAGPLPTGEAGGTREVGDVTLLEGVTARGQVLNEKGKPVPGAEVMVGNPLTVAPVSLLRAPVRADAQGRFAVEGLRSGPVRIVARAAEHHAYTPDGGGQSAEGPLQIVLPAPRTLTLALVDDQGEPVESLQSHARFLPIDGSDELPDFVFTHHPRLPEHGVSRDEQGRWVFTDLAPGRWELLLSPAGFGRVRQVFDLTDGDLEERIELTRARELRVRVVQSDGTTPVDYARVQALRDNDGSDMPSVVSAERTDEAGQAVLKGLADGDYLIEANHPALAVTSVPVTLPLPEEQVEVLVVLVKGGTIRGQVVEQGGPPREPLLVALMADNDSPKASALPRTAVTDAEGRFAFFDVEPGEVALQARDRIAFQSLTTWWEPFLMTAAAEAEVFVQSDQETEVTLVVGSAWADMETAFVEGRLTVNGSPGQGWKVRTFGKIRKAASVDAEGRFTLGQVAAGDGQQLLFGAPGQAVDQGHAAHLPLDLARDERRFVQVDLLTGSVEGVVLAGPDGQPLPGAAVSLEFTDPDSRRGWWGRNAFVTGTDGAGRFEFPMVTEGEYAVRVQAEGFAAARSEAFRVGAHRAVRGVEVRLLSSVSLSGRVVFEDLEEQPSWIFLNAESGSGERSGARVDIDSMTYHFNQLAPERSWKITAYTDLEIEMTVVERWVRSDEENVTLVFRPAPMEVESEESFDSIEEPAPPEDGR